MIYNFLVWDDSINGLRVLEFDEQHNQVVPSKEGHMRGRGIEPCITAFGQPSNRMYLFKDGHFRSYFRNYDCVHFIRARSVYAYLDARIEIVQSFPYKARKNFLREIRGVDIQTLRKLKVIHEAGLAPKLENEPLDALYARVMLKKL